MGSPLGPSLANLFMCALYHKNINFTMEKENERTLPFWMSLFANRKIVVVSDLASVVASETYCGMALITSSALLTLSYFSCRLALPHSIM